MSVTSTPRDRRTLKEWLIAANTTRNVAMWDRWVRASLPVVVLGLWAAGVLPPIAAIPLSVIAVMLFPTAISGACSVYYAMGVSTLTEDQRPPTDR